MARGTLNDPIIITTAEHARRAIERNAQEEPMKDPTSKNLEYALLDQRIAGIFHDKSYAWTPVPNSLDVEKWGAGIAVANEAGYHPIEGLSFDRREQARTFCDGMNRHIGLDPRDEVAIIASTMGGTRFGRLQKV